MGDYYQEPKPPRDIPHLLVPELHKISHWNDPHEFRVSNWIEPWDWQSPLDVGLISVPSNRTSVFPNRTSAAPNSIKGAWSVNTTYTPDYDVELATMKVREIGDIAVPVLDAREGIEHIEEALYAIFQQPEEFFPVIIGGDHGITAPAVRAFCKANPDKQVGLIQFDAHYDARVMDYGPTNGTPIRGILTSGVRVSGQNLVQIGIAGFQSANYYKRWIEGQGATIVTGREVRRRGIEEVIRKALEIAGRDTDAVYVTVDIDVLELAYGPGCSGAGPEGIHPTDLFEAMFILGQDPRVAAIDFVELDPYRDVAEITTRTFNSAMLTFLAGLFLRKNNGWRGYDPASGTE